MSKARRQVQQPLKDREQRNRGWMQLAIFAGVLLLAAAVLLLKVRTAQPEPATLAMPQAIASEEVQSTTKVASRELPQEQLKRLLAAGQPTLAFYHSNNCVQCTKMMEIVADVYPEFEASVVLVDVNVYDPLNRALLLQEGIHSIPTQVFYSAAGEGKLTVGAMPAQVFRSYMRAAAGEE